MSSEVFHPHRNLTGHPIPEVVLRTRRSVMEAANELKAQRTRKRRHAGIALLTLGALIVLFAPALMTVANDLSAGEHFFDLPVLVLTFFLVMLSAVFAVLLLKWRERDVHGEQR